MRPLATYEEVMFTKTTQHIKVTVTPNYLEQQSTPTDGQYVWSYTVQIENYGTQTVQLINRYWRITDGNGHIQEVRGPGVVGEQPILRPGEAFKYTSGTSLGTSSGIMQGNYEMVNDAGERFEIVIPVFSLDSPYQLARPN